MPIKIEPTKIKQSFYLLVPKNIAKLINMEHNTKLSLDLINSDENKVLEYRFE